MFSNNMNFLSTLSKKFTKQDYFISAPEFITRDNRTQRKLNVITVEQMTKRHRALFPDDLVKGKSVLDLGCCLGATGYWCLSAGASRYVGVETQKEYAELGSTLLEKYYPKEKGKVLHSSVEDFLEKNMEKFDIICLLGVIYAFVDYYTLLKKVTEISNGTIIVESVYHNTTKLGVDFCGVQFKWDQGISLASDFAYLMGKGTRISPKGLIFVMEDFGFKTEGFIYPEKILKTRDVFNITFPTIDSDKYLLMFTRSGENIPKSLSQDLSSEQAGRKIDW